MRTTFPILSFLLFAFTTIHFIRSLNASLSVDDTHVFDVFGDEVVTLNDYYIHTSPFQNSTVLGVTVANKTCPNVALSDTDNALPVRFFPRRTIMSNNEAIRLEQGVTIYFNSSNLCNTSTLWGINANIASIPWHVVVGGRDYNVFAVAKYNSSTDDHLYKIRYCPKNTYCVCKCQDIGYVLGDGVLYLEPGREPALPVVFTPAKKYFVS